MGRTSIPVSDETRDQLRELKEERGVSWNELLQDLASDSDSTTDNSNELRYDDVKQACQAAIRSELPVENMGR